MRKIVAGLFISLDGVIEAPHEWHFPYYNEEMGEAVQAQIAAADTMLLGRKTYEEFASYWPQQGSEVELADHMNGTPKLVVSTTLKTAEWQNSTIVRSIDELARLKDGIGGEIGITGSATLVQSLLRADVLDELRLLVHPIIVGTGKRLFEEAEGRVPLTLLDSQTFSTGVVYVTYGRAET